jgi:hypothetical protein
MRSVPPISVWHRPASCEKIEVYDLGVMSTVEEIKAAIDKLSLEERGRLERMLHGWTDDEWDRQIAEGAAAGKLDKLIAEVDADIDAGKIRDLP